MTMPCSRVSREADGLVDREIVATRLSRLRDSVRHLAEIAALDRDTYLRGPYWTVLGERYLHVSIEAMLDTANHIIAAQGFRKPLQLRDCFAILGEEQVIPQGFARDILPMVGLRNRLVHVYSEIDHEQIYEMLTTRLDDLETYARHIVAYVEKHTEAGESPHSP
jgi:uncharacterized protein YutE (UPF0331/DUF86 family)